MAEGPYLTLPEAAAKLRKSRRWLWDWLDKNPRDRFDRPYYRLAGRTWLMSEEDVARIFEDRHAKRTVQISDRLFALIAAIFGFSTHSPS